MARNCLTIQMLCAAWMFGIGYAACVSTVVAQGVVESPPPSQDTTGASDESQAGDSSKYAIWELPSPIELDLLLRSWPRLQLSDEQYHAVGRWFAVYAEEFSATRSAVDQQLDPLLSDLRRASWPPPHVVLRFISLRRQAMAELDLLETQFFTRIRRFLTDEQAKRLDLLQLRRRIAFVDNGQANLLPRHSFDLIDAFIDTDVFDPSLEIPHELVYEYLSALEHARRSRITYADSWFQDSARLAIRLGVTDEMARTPGAAMASKGDDLRHAHRELNQQGWRIQISLARTVDRYYQLFRAAAQPDQHDLMDDVYHAAIYPELDAQCDVVREILMMIDDETTARDTRLQLMQAIEDFRSRTRQFRRECVPTIDDFRFHHHFPRRLYSDPAAMLAFREMTITIESYHEQISELCGALTRLYENTASTVD